MNENELIKKEFYELGKLEGIDKAKTESYENGFREGVKLGVELGMYQGFLNASKDILGKWIQQNGEDEKISKLIKKINSCNYEDIEDAKNKVKIVKSNLTLIFQK